MIDRNSIVQGDCLDWLDRVEPNSIDLCYIDPPFFTQRDFQSFTDTWNGRDTYLSWMRRRIQKIHRVLKGTGSIFLHCDHHANYRLRIILDDIFGEKNFINEIVWCYSDLGGGGSPKFYKRKHDIIFWYSKSKDYKINKISRRGLSKSTIERYKKSFNKEGEIILGALKETEPGIYRSLIKKGRVKSGDCPNTVLFSKKNGTGVSDWWTSFFSIRSSQSLWETQKPKGLLKRIIGDITLEGDLVLDCFGGSGTTAAVAKTLGRDYIIGDVNPEAIEIMKTRLEVDR